MKKLIELNNPRAAQAFIDYMAQQNIKLQLMPEGQGKFALWVLEEKDEAQAEAELKLFLADPQAAKYSAASWQVATPGKSPFKYHGPSLLSMLQAKAGPMTLVVMLICVVIYVLQSIGMGQQVFDLLHFPAQASQQWQLWRWVSHALLHFSVMHIVFNLLWWWQFGGDIEHRLGAPKLGQIFVISAALSGAGQFWIAGAHFGGLSGVIYALLGYMWIASQRLPHLGLDLPRPLLGFMLVWLIIGFVQPVFSIANTAHLVGLFSGIGLAFFDASKNKYQKVS